MARMAKVAMFAAIRRDARIEGVGVRVLVRKYAPSKPPLPPDPEKPCSSTA
jgi:hypothetical protein